MWMFHPANILTILYSNETSMNLRSQKRMKKGLDVP